MNDYSSWYLQNKDLFKTLFENDSIVFAQFHDIVKVLDYIDTLTEKEISDELSVFKDTGFAYLFSKTEELKYYINHYFKDNLSKYLLYEVLINFAFYLDDLKETLEEKDLYTLKVNKGFNEIYEDIEDNLNNNKKFTNELIDKYNTILLSVVPTNTELLTIPEIFGRVAEELQL